jgi:D-3-phosphoglycerate dehydrogenase
LVIKKIWISNQFTNEAAEAAAALLSNYDCFLEADFNKTSDADAALIRSKDIVDQEFFNRHSSIKIVASATSGFDHFKLKEIENHNVALCHSPKANVCAASELSLFHMLSFLKHGKKLISEQPLTKEIKLLGSELNSKTVFIIGLGRIGSQVSKLLNAFGAKVLAYDPYIENDKFKYAMAQKTELNDGLRSADIVSLHCPLTQKTRHIISSESLALMQKDSLLINCARGELVKEKDLINALESSQIKGCALDVFENEPLSPDSRLRKLRQVITSPHIGGYTKEAQIKSALEAAQQVKNWFEDEKAVLSLVPPDVAWVRDL